MSTTVSATGSPRLPCSVLALLALLCLLCPAGSAAGGGKIKKAGLLFNLEVLNPETRASLEDINILLLHEDNLHLVWELELKPDLADVVIVACSPACHSSDILEALANWAKAGRGLFIGPTAQYQASRFLLPEDFFIEPTYLELPSGRSWLATDSVLTDNVQQVHHELWCSRDNTGSLKIRLRPEPDEEWPEELLTGPGELLEPVLTWGRFRPGGDPRVLVSSRPILLATLYQGARVVWYAHDLAMNKKCRPEYDDVRLWSNLMHWLADR